MAFRLLDLPQEIQDQVYYLYFEETHLQINHSNPLRFVDPPDLNIDLVCRKVCGDARRARSVAIRPSLHLRLGWLTHCLNPLLTPRYAWLHSHVSEIEFDDVPDLSLAFWRRFLDTFANVRIFDFNYVPGFPIPISIPMRSLAVQVELLQFHRRNMRDLARIANRRHGEHSTIKIRHRLRRAKTCVWTVRFPSNLDHS